MSGGPSRLPAARSRAGMPGRTSSEIRADIVSQREELATTVELLRARVAELTDWRRQVREHREQLITGAAIAGFVVGGLLAMRSRRRRARR